MRYNATTGAREADDCNTPAVQAERRILEYGHACAIHAREQLKDTRQRISEALALASEGVQA